MDDDETQGDITAPLMVELRTIMSDLEERLELDDEQFRVIGAGLQAAGYAGVRVGVAEILAQAIESGMDLKYEQHLDNTSVEDLLADEEEA